MTPSPPKQPSFVAPRKLYRIGDIMRYTGLSRQTIHNYTVLGLIREEERTPGGHRLYPESVFQQLQDIQDLRRTSTLREIREMLERESGGNTRKRQPWKK